MKFLKRALKAKELPNIWKECCRAIFKLIVAVLTNNPENNGATGKVDAAWLFECLIKHFVLILDTILQQTKSSSDEAAPPLFLIIKYAPDQCQEIFRIVIEAFGDNAPQVAQIFERLQELVVQSDNVLDAPPAFKNALPKFKTEMSRFPISILNLFEKRKQ